MTRAENAYLERYTVDEETLCWLWTGRRNMQGYGKHNVDGRQCGAHRLFYAHHVGRPLVGETPLHHLCAVRQCVNPWHLVQVTTAQHAALHPESIEQAQILSAEKKRARTHCVNGHAWTPENTHLRRDGARQCRACGREKQARYLKRRNHGQS